MCVEKTQSSVFIRAIKTRQTAIKIAQFLAATIFWDIFLMLRSAQSQLTRFSYVQLKINTRTFQLLNSAWCDTTVIFGQFSFDHHSELALSENLAKCKAVTWYLTPRKRGLYCAGVGFLITSNQSDQREIQYYNLKKIAV